MPLKINMGIFLYICYMSKKIELVAKFERNKELVETFLKEYKKYIDESGTWDGIAFFDSKLTNQQYYDELVRVSSVEYSQEQTKNIKILEAPNDFLDQCIAGLDTQHHSLTLLYHDLLARNN
jgi:hypothetical protein